MSNGVNFADVETFGNLKELYSDDVKFQEHIQSSLYNFIRKAGDDEVEFDGLVFKTPVSVQYNESYAAINDGERLPQAGKYKSVWSSYKPKLMYSSIEATQFAATRGHKNGRPNGKYLDDLMRSTLITFISNIDADCYGNGRGKRARVSNAVAAASSFQVDSSMLLRAGMVLDWYDATLTTKRGSIMIDVKAVDRMNKTPYIDPNYGSGAVPAGAVAGDYLVVAGALAAGEPTDGRHIAGLERITDNTLSLGGLSPSDYAAWMAVNQNASFGNITQELLQMQFDSMYLIGGVYPNRMAFNTGQKRTYLSQFFSQRRFTTNSFDTGASSITFDPVKMGKDEKNKKPGDFEMLEDKNAPLDTMYFWHDSCLCTASDYSDTPHLADEDGSELRIRPGYDALAGFYRFWMNTVVFQRNHIGKIYQLSTPSGSL